MSNKTINCNNRNKELLELYTQALNFTLNNHVPAAHDAAVKIALRMSRPRYRLSFGRAYRIVASIILHNRYLVNGEKCRNMWKEIADMVNYIIISFPQISIAKALEFVLDNGRGSSLFISQRQANQCIYKAKMLRTRQLVNQARRKSI